MHLLRHVGQPCCAAVRQAASCSFTMARMRRGVGYKGANLHQHPSQRQDQVYAFRDPVGQRSSPSAYVSRSPRCAFERLSLTSWMTTLEALSKNSGMILPMTAGTTSLSLAAIGPACPPTVPAKAMQHSTRSVLLAIGPGNLPIDSTKRFLYCFHTVELAVEEIGKPFGSSGLHASPTMWRCGPQHSPFVPPASPGDLQKWVTVVSNAITQHLNTSF